tara:strand:+ start:682 stop:858 length:177 start_codon:yes stop_codon:yes gene_type:complete
MIQEFTVYTTVTNKRKWYITAKNSDEAIEKWITKKDKGHQPDDEYVLEDTEEINEVMP